MGFWGFGVLGFWGAPAHKPWRKSGSLERFSQLQQQGQGEKHLKLSGKPGRKEFVPAALPRANREIEDVRVNDELHELRLSARTASTSAWISSIVIGSPGWARITSSTLPSSAAALRRRNSVTSRSPIGADSNSPLALGLFDQRLGQVQLNRNAHTVHNMAASPLACQPGKRSPPHEFRSRSRA